MSTPLTLSFTERPGVAGSYARILLRRRSGLRPGTRLPMMAATWRGAQADPLNVRRYLEVTGLTGEGALPVLYPHVLAAPIHMRMLSDPAFPLPLLGSLHVRNHILQHQPLDIEAPFDIRCTLAGQRNARKGLELDVGTELTTAGTCVWESVSTFFIRGRFGDEDPPSPLDRLEPIPEAQAEDEWKVPLGTGRRYARVSGDYNPIHVAPLTAKLFGMKRDIAHGMWALAHSLNRLPPLDATLPHQVDVAFKGPTFMGSTVVMKAVHHERGHRFDLYCGNNPRPVLQAEIRTVEAGVRLVDESGGD